MLTFLDTFFLLPLRGIKDGVGGPLLVWGFDGHPFAGLRIACNATGWPTKPLLYILLAK